MMLRRKKKLKQALISEDENLLRSNVLFYKNLDKTAQQEFLHRVRQFLAKVLITGVKTNIENIDRVLIAAAAIIPIFQFKNWEYKNLDEVLVYPHSFSSAFSFEGDGRNVIGMVGTGPMERTMILSKPDLRAGFSDNLSKSNTAIHEFVHLIDKSDGCTDGLPSILLEHKYAVPWLEYINKNIQAIEKAVGQEAILELLPLQAGDVPDTYADSSALEKSVGYKPSVSVEDGVKQFVDWYRDFYQV